MFLIVGLGNPGREYENTRHNAGFMTVDALADECRFTSFKSKFDGEIAEGKIEGEKVYILKPHTYMNLSGNSVIKAANFYKILPQNIIVIHDDMDLAEDMIKYIINYVLENAPENSTQKVVEPSAGRLAYRYTFPTYRCGGTSLQIQVPYHRKGSDPPAILHPTFSEAWL